MAVGSTPPRLAVTRGGVWVSEFEAGSVARIDSATLTVTCRVAVGAQPEGLATDGRTLWVVLQADHELVAVDGATGAVRRRIPLPDAREPRLALAVGGTVWVSDYSANRLVVVDAATGRLLRIVPACFEPQGMAVGAGRVWVGCAVPGRLVGVPLTGRGSPKGQDLPNVPDGVAVSAGRVYVALADGPGLAVLDIVRATPAHVTTFAATGPVTANVDVLVTRGQVWVNSYNESALHVLPA